MTEPALHPVTSLCPECLRTIPGQVTSTGGAVVMGKVCAEHGAFECVVSSDPQAYERMRDWPGLQRSPEQTAMPEAAGCPDDCGLCPAHEQHTCLAIVEITSRCNLDCPVCLAASTAEGEDLTVDQVAAALGKLLQSEGAAVPLQFAGGEPTQHPDLLAIVAKAREMGFTKMEVDSNGLLLAKHPGLAKDLRAAGLSGVYLQMDGLDPREHSFIRGRDLGPEKLGAIENCQNAGLQVVLSVTVVPDVNDHRIWDLVRFGIERRLTGVNFQSIALSGRYPDGLAQRAERFTAGHFMREIEAQSGGELLASDLMPMSCPDPRCGLLAYVIVTKDGALVPVNRVLGDQRMIEPVAEFTDWEPLLRQIGCGCGPDADQMNALADHLDGAECFSIGFHGMMDAYSFDVDRARRCCVHKLTKEGKLMPFCLYNTKYRPGEGTGGTMTSTNSFKDYLPPDAFLPANCRLLDELHYPDRVNLTEELLDANMAERAGKVAIYFEAERITYGQLRAKVNRFANALRGLGVGKNDRVVLRALNGPEYFVWNFACWRIGAIPVLVSHLNRASEIAFKVNDSDALAICVDEASYPDLAKARAQCPNLKHVIVDGERIADTLSYQDLLAGQSDQAPSEDTARGDFGRIIYSSGTTGQPKAILTTVEGILALPDTQGRHILKVREDDILGGHPTFSFAFGAANFLYIPWRFGASVSVIANFTPERQFELIEEHGITMLFGVPTAFRMMLGIGEAEQKHRHATLRLAQSAGEPLPETTEKEWRKRFGHTIINSLGSGDLNYWLSTTEQTPEDKIGSVGRSVPGYENVVVDENLDPVEPGTPGELIVRGPVGQLYWRRPDAQQKGVCPPTSNYPGWSRPGLHVLEDRDGYFWYKSRIDDMIVTSGYKIPGGEVEDALNNHPAVLESAAIGVPDEERGNIIKAFVVLKDGTEPSDRLARDLQEFVKREIEPYKYPRKIEFRDGDALPRTSTGKIQRNLLRQREIASDL